jgi:hypothetical protein
MADNIAYLAFWFPFDEPGSLPAFLPNSKVVSLFVDPKKPLIV